jgi:hypothetical protein
MLFTIFAFFGFIFMFLGIGLIMFLVQAIFAIILVIALIIRIVKNKNNYLEWGLLLGVFWAAVSLVRFL